MHLVGLTELEVGGAAELLSLVRQAEQLRATGATSANETSSRSHAILQARCAPARTRTHRASQHPASRPQPHPTRPQKHTATTSLLAGALTHRAPAARAGVAARGGHGPRGRQTEPGRPGWLGAGG